MTQDGTTYKKLDNGLTVILKENHNAPVASFWAWYRVGSRNEVPGITGISHWVEHMLFKGTPTFPKGTLDREISRNGGTWNGMTWLDYTTYFETLPADRFDLALRIEADRMVNSLFDPNEVESERTVIISEREGNENYPTWLLGEEVQAIAFRVHPYHHEVIGDKSDLQTMTREQLWQHYKMYYAPNNALVVAVGDFESAQLMDRIAELFGRIPAGPPLPGVPFVEPAQRGERRVHVKGPGATAYLQMAFHVPDARHPDIFPLIVLDTILGGAQSMTLFGGSPPSKSSRLYKALVETELATSVYSNLSLTIDPFLFYFGATVRTGRTLAEVEAALWAELQRAVQQPVTPEEVAKAVKQTQAQFAYSSESVTNQAFWLGYSEIVTGSYTWFYAYLDRIGAVTAADIQRVAATYLTETNRVVGWYLPENKESQ